MANELSYRTSVNFSKAGATVTVDKQSNATVAGNNYIDNVQAIATTTTQLVFGDVGSIGKLRVENLDATNYVVIDTNTPAASTTGFCHLLPGEHAFVPTRRGTLYAKADTAAVNVRVTAIPL